MRIRRRTKRRIRRLIFLSPLLALIAFTYFAVRPPSRAAPLPLTVPTTLKNIDRGRYLFTALLACDRCHSPLDFTRLHNPILISARGSGRGLDLRDLPGTVTAPNLTMDPETGLGKWSDGEIIRAIREGIDKAGNALYPLMPYRFYRTMTDEDVLALVAYMKSLAPIRSDIPRTNLTYMARMSIKSEPRPSGRVPPQDDLGGAIYGEYLVGIAACESCHTPPRLLLKPKRFSGGVLFSTPYGEVRSANITQDNVTGIGRLTFQQFEARMHQHRKYANSTPPRVGGEQFTVMPWENYADITDKDLESMFLFLRSATAVESKVQVHPGIRGK